MRYYYIKPREEIVMWVFVEFRVGCQCDHREDIGEWLGHPWSGILILFVFTRQWQEGDNIKVYTAMLNAGQTKCCAAVLPLAGYAL